MSSENRQLVRRAFNELWNRGRLEVADEIFSSDYVSTDPVTPDFGTGPDAEKQIVTLYRKAFPDLVLTLDQIIDADDSVITRFRARGTHKGAFRRIAATNRSIQVEGMVIHRIWRGKIAEARVLWDAIGLMQQLGVMPSLEMSKRQGAD